MAYIGAYSVNLLSANAFFSGLSVDFVGSLADGGIKFSNDEDVATLTKGLHGGSVHNIGVSSAGTVTFSLLAGSPADLALNNVVKMYRAGSLHPNSCVASVRDGYAKTTFAFTGLSIKTVPERAFNKEVGARDWVFQYSELQTIGGV